MSTLERAVRAFAIASGLMLLLSGCATMDAESCQGADWRQIGADDGAGGQSADQFDTYQRECREFGIQADHASYQAGWNEGITLYCTRDNGYVVGRKGDYYGDTCPGAMRDPFYVGYMAGRAISQAQARIDQVQHALDEVRDEAAKDDLTGEQRGALRAKRKELERDMEGARYALTNARLEAQRLGFQVY